MALSNTSRPRLFVAAILALAVAWLGLALRVPGWRPGDLFLHGSYDSLHWLSGIQDQATVDSPVVIVYLDLPSFQQEKQDPARPWPRELHAQLLRRLTRAGARAVVFDIVFTAPGPNTEADEAFAKAIRENGRVILAAEHNYSTV